MKLNVRKRVAISCVTFETVKIVKPICYLGRVDRVYLLHYERPDPGKKRLVYLEFYDEVVRQLKEEEACGEIVERNVRVYRFKEVLAELMAILRRERDEGNDVYINVSAGTSEFVAAATIASMMVENVFPYTVGTKEYTVADEGLRVYFDGDRPVGMAKDVFDPNLLPTFHIEMPPNDLVTGLKLLKGKKEKSHSTTYGSMIAAIREAGCWHREGTEKTKDPVQAEKMYYLRHFIDEWVRRGWVTKDSRGHLSLTDDGEMVTEVF